MDSWGKLALLSKKNNSIPTQELIKRGAKSFGEKKNPKGIKKKKKTHCAGKGGDCLARAGNEGGIEKDFRNSGRKRVVGRGHHWERSGRTTGRRGK